MTVNLQEWVRAHTREVTIPSGLVVTIKPATLQELAMAGLIPLSLTETYDKAASDLATTDDLAEVVDKIKPIVAMYEAVCMAIMIFPKLGATLDLENGVITFDMLTWEDKTYLFNEANKGFSLLNKFREES